MSSSIDKKLVSALEVVLMMSKIMEDKLTSPNYLDWSKIIQIYLRKICMANHLTKDPPIDDLKEKWMEEDAHLFLQFHSSIDNKVLCLINHYEFLVYLMCVKPFIDQRKMIGLSWNFVWTIKRHMRSLICYCPLVHMSKFNKLNKNKWQ